MMDTIKKYEIKAKAFLDMTGYMAPGKSEPVGGSTGSLIDRQAAWTQWLKQYGSCIDSTLSAIRYVEGEDELSGELMPEETECAHHWQQVEQTTRIFCTICGKNSDGVWVRDSEAASGQWFSGQRNSAGDILFGPITVDGME